LEGNISAAYVFGAQAALVEVDQETGEVKVLKVVSVHDSGRIINPMAAEGQVHGGVHMGIGYALYEELVLEQGRVVNASFADYHVPNSPGNTCGEGCFCGEPGPGGAFRREGHWGDRLYSDGRSHS
jgi:xanthine dehydrogenase molybdopterin-binding subunit B